MPVSVEELVVSRDIVQQVRRRQDCGSGRRLGECSGRRREYSG